MHMYVCYDYITYDQKLGNQLTLSTQPNKCNNTRHGKYFLLVPQQEDQLISQSSWQRLKSSPIHSCFLFGLFFASKRGCWAWFRCLLSPALVLVHISVPLWARIPHSRPENRYLPAVQRFCASGLNILNPSMLRALSLDWAESASCMTNRTHIVDS